MAETASPAKGLFPFLGDVGEDDVFLGIKGVFDEVSDFQRQGNLLLGGEASDAVIQRLFQYYAYPSFFCRHFILLCSTYAAPLAKAEHKVTSISRDRAERSFATLSSKMFLLRLFTRFSR